MALKRTRVVVTPGCPQPYKVVFEDEQHGTSEHPVGSIKEGEALIRVLLDRIEVVNEPRPWNGPSRWTTDILKTAYQPPAELEPELQRLLGEAEAALAKLNGGQGHG